ncbi:MAG: hypothetical protein IJ770_00100 [Alphaproteobacteria bacterium]|nr:hypothetical protein [Alphaproteobacteria bacterium]
MYRFFANYLFVITVLSLPAAAEGLPANPWLNAAPETYTIQETHSVSVQNEQNQTDTKQPTVVNVNFNILMNFFASPFQTTPSAKYTQSGAMADFLNNIGQNGGSHKSIKSRRSAAEMPNPIDDAAAAYNRYMENMQQKYDDAKMSIENYYYDKMNALKNLQQDTTRSIRKLMK